MHCGIVRRAVCLFLPVIVLVFFIGRAFGANADQELLTRAQQLFKPVPKLMESEQNPVTPEKVRLGKMLFYESRISIDGTVSCAKCHPIALYAVDALRTSVGNHCTANPRNAPTLFNAADQISQHWIGNRTSVEDQARQSLVGPPSFGMAKYEDVEKRLKEYRDYVALFKEAFPSDNEPVTAVNFAQAVGAFERTLVTPSPFDAYLAGNEGSLTAQQRTGVKTFIETGCTACHSGTYFGGQRYQKFGIIEPYWKYTGSGKIDEGRYAVTKIESDKYVFKVPVLRNVEKTAPYFHDGSIDSMEDAVRIMGKVQLGRDITGQQASDIVAFLKSLTGEIPDDILKVPLLPSKE